MRKERENSNIQTNIYHLTEIKIFLIDFNKYRNECTEVLMKRRNKHFEFAIHCFKLIETQCKGNRNIYINSTEYFISHKYRCCYILFSYFRQDLRFGLSTKHFMNYDWSNIKVQNKS